MKQVTNPKTKKLTLPDQHQLRVLRQLIKMNDAAIPFTGGGYNNSREVAAVLKRKFGYTDAEIRRLRNPVKGAANPKTRRIFQVDLSDDSRLAILALSQTAADNIVARQAKRDHWKSSFDGKPLTVIREKKKNPVKGAANPSTQAYVNAIQDEARKAGYRATNIKVDLSIKKATAIVHDDLMSIRLRPKSVAPFRTWTVIKNLWAKNPHGFVIVDQHLNVQAKGQDFDKLQDRSDKHNNEHNEQWFVIDADDLKEVRGKGMRKAGNPEIMGRHVSAAVLDNVFHNLVQYYQSSVKDRKKSLPNMIRYLELKVGGLSPRQAKAYINDMEQHLMPKRNPVKGGGVVNPRGYTYGDNRYQVLVHPKNSQSQDRGISLDIWASSKDRAIAQAKAQVRANGKQAANFTYQVFLNVDTSYNGSATGGAVNPNDALTALNEAVNNQDKSAFNKAHNQLFKQLNGQGKFYLRHVKLYFGRELKGNTNATAQLHSYLRDLNNLSQFRNGFSVKEKGNGYAERAYAQNEAIPVAKRNSTATDFKATQSNKLKELAKMFQGSVSGEKRRVLESDYTPKDKYRLGYLVQIKIKDGGKIVPINFDGEAYLSADLKNNLWVAGKDAIIDNIKRPANGTLKYLGEVVQVDYITAKKHIEGGKTVRFYHKLGEVTREKPNLFLDHDGFPIFVGGAYDVWDVGIVN